MARQALEMLQCWQNAFPAESVERPEQEHIELPHREKPCVPGAKQERIRISERVRAGLTTARNKGKRLGRPRVFVSHARIESLRQEGMSWREIAAELNSNTATVSHACAVEAS